MSQQYAALARYGNRSQSISNIPRAVGRTHSSTSSHHGLSAKCTDMVGNEIENQTEVVLLQRPGSIL